MNDHASVPFLNIFDPGFDFDAAEVSDARELSWYANSPLGPLVLRHKEAEGVLRDQRFRLGGEGYMRALGVTSGPLYDWWMHCLMSVDAPDHARLRRLLNKVFTPRVVENLRPFTVATGSPPRSSQWRTASSSPPSPARSPPW